MRRTLLSLFLCGCTITEANDIFKPTQNNDRNFTQGLQVSTGAEAGEAGDRYYARQIFYTPNHKRLHIPLSNERPYAGALLAGFTQTDIGEDHTRRVWGYEFGVVGPSSFSEQTQRTVHRFLGQSFPQGWDYQLRDEPGINISRQLQDRVAGNILTDVRFDVGNMFDQVTIGVLYKDAPDGLYPRIRLREGLNIGFFAGVYGRGVARNIFLDGNTFKDSRSVDKYPFVAEGRAGISLEYGDYKFSYTYIKMSPEYVGGDAADFGEISLTIH